MVLESQPVPSLQSLEGTPIHQNRLLRLPSPSARGTADGYPGVQGGYGPGSGGSEVAPTLMRLLTGIRDVLLERAS